MMPAHQAHYLHPTVEAAHVPNRDRETGDPGLSTHPQKYTVCLIRGLAET
jgi:hypothetical protein